MSDLDLSIGVPEEPSVAVTADSDSDPWAGEPDELLEEYPEVAEPVVRGLLSAMGAGLSVAFGDPDVAEHWRFTDRELRDLTPPVTRIVNRRPALRRAVHRGDEVSVAVQLAGYMGRNMAAGSAARRAREDYDGDDLDGEADPVGAAGWPAGGPAAGPGPSFAGHGPGVPGPVA